MRMPSRMMRVVMGLVMVGMAGCGPTRSSQRAPAPVSIVKPQAPEIREPKRGSIWQSTDRNTLFLDNKARNVGDIVVVTISESSSAQKTASTDLKRDDSNNIGLGGLFGLTAAAAGANPAGALVRGNPGFADSAKITGKHEYKGSGATSRKGTFTATISCTVAEVLSNGNLRIEGRRDITVNNENQFIILSGVIRPEDISHGNTVASSQISDARIDYSGEGDVDDQQQPGWLNRFFSTIRVL